MFDIKEIFPRCFLITSDSEFEIIDAFLRPQEFYESPYENIQNKFFTLEEYIQTYAKDTGNFTYHSDWSGFNIPGNVFSAWIEEFRPEGFRPNEQLLVDMLKWVGITENTEECYYLIGCHRDSYDIMDHEVAHALYYLNYEYNIETLKLITKISKEKNNYYWKLKQTLLENGYTNDVVVDEIQAFLSTSTNEYLCDRWDVNVDQQTLDMFKSNFDKFKKQILSPTKISNLGLHKSQIIERIEDVLDMYWQLLREVEVHQPNDTNLIKSAHRLLEDLKINGR